MWTVCITSIRHVLKLKGYGEPQAKANEKRQRFKGWETLVSNLIKGNIFLASLCLLKGVLLKDSYFLPIYQNSLTLKSASALRKRPNMFNLRIHAGLDVFFFHLCTFQSILCRFSISTGF